MFWEQKNTGLKVWSIAFLVFISWAALGNLASAQTFRAISNNPSPETNDVRNGRINLHNCQYLTGIDYGRKFCHSLTYAGGQPRVFGYFDVFDSTGVLLSRTLIPILMQYFPFFQDTIWFPSPNAINGIPSPSDTILNAMTCDFSGNIFAAGRGISTYRPSTGVLDLPRRPAARAAIGGRHHPPKRGGLHQYGE